MVDETNNPLEAAAPAVPLGSKLYYTRDKQPVLLKRDVVVTGDQLTDASFQPNTQDGPAVSVSLDSRGASKMLKNTQENIGPSDGGGVHRPIARKERRRASMSIAPPRKSSIAPPFAAFQQQLSDHRREPDRRTRARAAAARRRPGGAAVRRSRSAPSVRASARTTSTRACTPWCSACWPPSFSWPSTTSCSA